MKLWGKYRGIVVDHKDPEQRGRLRIKCPLALPPNDNGTNNVLDWALPMLPMAGVNNVGLFTIPEEGANVWVEFEQGDIDKPVWFGGWISSPGNVTHTHDNSVYLEETPAPGAYWDIVAYNQSAKRTRPSNKTLSTKSGHIIEFDDEADQLKIRIADSAGQEILMRSVPGRERIQLTDKTGNHFLMDATLKRIHAQDVSGSFFLMDGMTGDMYVGAVRNLVLAAAENIVVSAGKNLEGSTGANWRWEVGGAGTLKTAGRLDLGGTGGPSAARRGDAVAHPGPITGGSGKVYIVD
jgi:hypothetical protein